jgi:hypothetical protein
MSISIQFLVLAIHSPNKSIQYTEIRFVFNLFLIEFKRLEYLHGYLLEYTK